MKTPMQEHIEWLKKEHELIQRLGGENERLLIEECIEHAESMLEKEKEVIENAYDSGQESNWSENMGLMGDWYYDKTFNNE